MKKQLLVCLWFISVSVIAQKVDEPYEFPVLPGSEQWAELSTSKQMDEVCVVPDEVLEYLSTKALLITCLDYPRLIDVYCANDIQSGFEFSSNHFNGLKKLLKRDNLNETLLSYYPDVDVAQYPMISDDEKLSFLQIAFLELLLSQNTILQGYKKNEIQRIQGIAIKNLETRRSKDESLGRQVSTALLLCRTLDSKDLNSSYFTEHKNVLTAFNTKGIVLDASVIDEILNAAKAIN